MKYNLITFLIINSNGLTNKFEKEMMSARHQDIERPSSSAWCMTKKRIYGAPGMLKFMVSTSVSSQSYTMESTPPSSLIQSLKEQIKKKR